MAIFLIDTSSNVRDTGMYSAVVCFIQFRGSRSLSRVYMELLKGTA